MMPGTPEEEIGRRRFIRSAALLGIGASATLSASGCSETGQDLPTTPAEDLVAGRKWIRLDSVDLDSGIFTSMDGFTDAIEEVFSSDVEWTGHSILPSGEIIPLDATVEREGANSLSIVSLGDGQHHLESAGVPYPPGAPYEIQIVERTIPGTEVLVFTGTCLDPSTGKRIHFNVTHDPIPAWLALAIALGILAATAQPAHTPGLSCPTKRRRRRIRIKPGPRDDGDGDDHIAMSQSSSGGLTITSQDFCSHDQGGGS